LLRRGNVSDLAQVDPAGRAWVVSNRPARDGSLVEAFEGGAHIGAVQLPGRVLAIHVLDTLLAALTEDAAIGTDGLYPRRLAWYRLPDTLGGLAQRE